MTNLVLTYFFISYNEYRNRLSTKSHTSCPPIHEPHKVKWLSHDFPFKPVWYLQTVMLIKKLLGGSTKIFFVLKYRNFNETKYLEINSYSWVPLNLIQFTLQSLCKIYHCLKCTPNIYHVDFYKRNRVSSLTMSLQLFSSNVCCEVVKDVFFLIPFFYLSIEIFKGQTMF